MNINTKLIDFLCRKQKWIEGISIFLLCLSIGFKYDDGKTTWMWNNYPFLAIIIVLTLLIVAITWIRIERLKVDKRIKKIWKKHADSESESTLDQLSNRQQEVLKLIGEGKSNKEIMADLFIEHSTIKTHINMIYKTLKIKNRKEAKVIIKASKT